MNLKYLEYFCTLAAYQHYTRAAEELGIAQSSLSHAIDCLESELGVYLFEKQGRNIVLTRQGSQYLQYVQSALQLLEDGKMQMRKSSAGIISIGFVSSVKKFLLEKIQIFQNNPRYKGCQFMLYEGATEPLLDDLNKNRLDFILASNPNTEYGFTSTSLLRQRIVVIDSDSSPKISGSSIRVSQLAKLPLVMHTPNSGMRKVTDALLNAHRCRPLIVGEASEDSIIIQMVSMGLGAAVVTESEDIHQPGIRVIDLEDANNYRYIYLTVKKGAYRAPVVDAFINTFS